MEKAIYIRDMVFDKGRHNPIFAGGLGKYIIYLPVTEEGKKFAKKFNVGISPNVWGCYLSLKEAKERLKDFDSKNDKRWGKGIILNAEWLKEIDWLYPPDFQKDF